MGKNFDPLHFVLVALLASGLFYSPRSSGTAAAGASTTSVAVARAPVAVPADGAVDARTLLARHLNIDASKPGLDERVAQAIARDGLTVRSLLATVPDPIDSFAGWTFDPLLEALQSGIYASHYVLDQFYIPDWPGGPADPTRPALHERFPGLILFRNATPGSSELLLVFLVFETPTDGVHEAAFVEALRDMIALSLVPTEPLRFLAPCYSGSTESIRRSLTHFGADAFGRHSLRFISGSATSPTNKTRIETTFDAIASGSRPAITFHATVASDEVIRNALAAFIQSPDSGLAGRRVAILRESNTAWGSTLQPADTLDIKNLQPWNDIVEMTFPMHISRIRSAPPQAAGAASDLPVVDRHSPLPLEDLGQPKDQFPSLNAKTTAPEVELVLANLLSRIRREDVGVVGLLATDTRDKLFLANQIRRFCPNVALFTTEADLLYTHPDFSADMAGMVVASSYPVFSGNQRWTPSTINSRQQFVMSTGEGVYNAAVALLNYDEHGVLLPLPKGAEDSARPRLLEYRPAFANAAAGAYTVPPVWISTVGRAGIWPIKSVALPQLRANHDREYLFTAAMSAEEAATAAAHPGTFALPDRVRLAIIAFLLFALTHAIVVLTRLPVRAPFIRRFDRCVPDERRQFLIGCLGALVVGSVLAQYIAMTEAAALNARTWTATLSAITTVLLVTAVALTIIRYRRRVRDAGTALYERIYEGALAVFTVIVASLFVAFMRSMGLLTYSRWIPSWAAGTAPSFADRAAFAERLVNLTSGVSPAVPLILLAAALYVWGFQHLRRPLMPRAADINVQLRKIVELIGEATVDVSVLCHAVTRAMTATLVASTVLYAILLMGRDVSGIASASRVFGPDGHYYNPLYATALAMMLVLTTLSLVHFLHLWRSLKQVLVSVAHQPRVLAAYARIPRSCGTAKVLTAVPSVADLGELVEQWQLLVEHWPAAALSKWSEADALKTRLESSFRHDTMRYAHGVWSKTATAACLDEAATLVAGLVKPTWIGESWGGKARAPKRDLAIAGLSPLFARLGAVDAPPAAPAPAPELDAAWIGHAEEFLALRLLLSIRDVLGRLVNSLGVIAGGNLLALASYSTYPFQPRQLLFAIGWANITAAVIAVVYVLAQIERNEVLSRVTHTEPGQINFNSVFVSRLLLYAAVPLVTLFATQFPQVGAAIVQWLAPMQKIAP